MHDYSIDNHPKEKVLFGLAFIAISAAPSLNRLIQQLIEALELTEKLGSPAVTAIPVFALFGLVYWVFDKYLWRIPFARRLLLVPDLNGKWAVSGSTALQKGECVDFRWDGELTVSQSWSKMRVHLRTKQSTSNSVAASLHHEAGIGYKLLYQYENSPSADQIELNKHSGAVELLFDLKVSSASGHYYTDQHRDTVGTMNVTRTSDA
jgi:hypothetical protein